MSSAWTELCLAELSDLAQSTFLTLCQETEGEPKNGRNEWDFPQSWAENSSKKGGAFDKRSIGRKWEGMKDSRWVCQNRCSRRYPTRIEWIRIVRKVTQRHRCTTRQYSMFQGICQPPSRCDTHRKKRYATSIYSTWQNWQTFGRIGIGRIRIGR
jgi:hypothetical protein